MHSLAQLQEHLAAAFGAAAKPHDLRPADEVVPLAPAAPRQKHPLRTLLFYWLGGLGLFAAIALLALGKRADLCYFLPALQSLPQHFSVMCC
ncbi:hypothetical protein AJ87_04345 [Rhizobium yanglingense]|nr:hypothetical protein AJ87_04345 [Rhizobium yanglingense]